MFQSKHGRISYASFSFSQLFLTFDIGSILSRSTAPLSFWTTTFSNWTVPVSCRDYPCSNWACPVSNQTVLISNRTTLLFQLSYLSMTMQKSTKKSRITIPFHTFYTFSIQSSTCNRKFFTQNIDLLSGNLSPSCFQL